MTTSLELSKELWEKGLKIETEKWWAHRYDKDKMELISRKETPDIIKCLTDYGYPAPSINELLAVMPCEIMVNTETYRGISELTIAKHIDNLFSVGYGKHYSCPYQEDKSLPEALGKMCLYLLSNGYILKSGELVKGHKINLGRKCSQKTKEKKGQ